MTENDVFLTKVTKKITRSIFLKFVSYLGTLSERKVGMSSISASSAQILPSNSIRPNSGCYLKKKHNLLPEEKFQNNLFLLLN